MENRDYIFDVKWQDRHKEMYTVAMLAQIDKEYYFISSDSRHLQKAYKSGYVGIPGFKIGEVYKSSKLFDFFINRVLNKDSINPCEELVNTRGISMIDSFSVEEVSEEARVRKNKRNILEAYKIQEKRKNIKKTFKSADSR